LRQTRRALAWVRCDLANIARQSVSSAIDEQTIRDDQPDRFPAIRGVTSDMRVRITRPPTSASIDGISLWRFRAGNVYALPPPIATLMIVEGWALPVADSFEPTLPAISFRLDAPVERRRRVFSRQRLHTEPGLAADRRGRKQP
jgi:hypothetical protein